MVSSTTPCRWSIPCLYLLLTRVWFSPAAVIVFQVITLALTVAWGIKLLSGHGLPAWAGWGLSILFAVSPVNGNMAATLWKDIPYSTCLLLMSLMFLKNRPKQGRMAEKEIHLAVACPGQPGNQSVPPERAPGSRCEPHRPRPGLPGTMEKGGFQPRNFPGGMAPDPGSGL